MSREEVIDKIKKLLRMKRGGTPGEIEAALNIARELAAKYGVDLDAVNPDDEQEQRTRPLGHEEAIMAARIQWECKYAALIAQKFFNVSMLLRQVPLDRWPGYRYAITLIGTEWDRQIALYVFKFLCGHFRREWTTRRGRCRNRQAFMYGMFVGLSQKLEEQRRADAPENEPGLVRLEHAVARRKDYMAKHFGPTETASAAPDTDADAAKIAGWRAGRDTEIRGGVKDAERASAERLGTGEGGQLLLGRWNLPVIHE
jgi:hypothetical protein